MRQQEKCPKTRGALMIPGLAGAPPSRRLSLREAIFLFAGDALLKT